MNFDRMNTIQLYFSGGSSPELQKTVFRNAADNQELRAIRGRTPGAFSDHGTFLWTSAVQALCVLLLRSAASRHSDQQATLEGESGSLASALDYALSKQVAWLFDIFGSDGSGDTLARRLIARTNPERKRPGPVVISLNPRGLRAEGISVFIDNALLSSASEISAIAQQLEVEHARQPGSVISRPTTIEVNLAALRANLSSIKQLVQPAKIMAVVKANAYGHGLVTCAHELERAGADHLGVAFVEEGIELRRAGVQLPILVFGGILDNQIRYFFDYSLDIPALSVSKVEAIDRVAKELGKRARVHLKIDTGMERLGQHFYTAGKLFEKAIACRHVEIVGVFSQLACADDEDLSFTKLQLERFNEAVSFFERRSLPMPLRHIANSAALTRLPESRLDMVRPGLALYGINPCPGLEMQINLQPVMTLKSSVVYFKVTKQGAGVSYGQTWKASKDTRIITIPIGYGDGLPRRLSNRAEVLVRGKRYPVVGTICMDQLMVDIGNGEAYNGDEVVLIGSQDKEAITMWDVARHAETIPWEIMTTLNQRIPRVYKDSAQPV